MESKPFPAVRYHEMMQALKVDGKEENDHSALVNYFEKLANIEVKRG